MANTALTPVEFHGATLSVILINDVPHVALKPICEAIGLDWQAQHARIKRHPVLSTCVFVTKTQIPGDDQARDAFMLPLDKLNGWLFGVSVRRVRPELRERLTRYQAECFDVLARHFGSAAPRQDTRRLTFSAPPAPSLSAQAMAAIDTRAGQITGSMYAELRQWLIGRVLTGCVRPDGTLAHDFDATLAGADFAAFSTQYGSKHMHNVTRLLQYVQEETGHLLTRLEAEKNKRDGAGLDI